MKHLKSFNRVPASIGELLCKKSLYKSTYKANAFIEGNVYKILDEDDKTIFIEDETGDAFSFSKFDHGKFYFIDDYFE